MGTYSPSPALVGRKKTLEAMLERELSVYEQALLRLQESNKGRVTISNKTHLVQDGDLAFHVTYDNIPVLHIDASKGITVINDSTMPASSGRSIRDRVQFWLPQEHWSVSVSYSYWRIWGRQWNGKEYVWMGQPYNLRGDEVLNIPWKQLWAFKNKKRYMPATPPVSAYVKPVLP